MARKNNSYTRRETPWLQKRNGSEIYHAYWRKPGNPNPGKLSLGTTEISEAEDRFAAFLIEKSRELSFEVTDEVPQHNLTVELAMQDYLKEGGIEGEFTDHQRQVDCSKNLLPFFGPMRVCDIDIQTSRDYKIARYKGEIGRTKAKAGTVIRELNCLVASISHEVKWKRFPKKLTPFIEKPSAPPPKDIWLTVEQMKEWINAAHGRTKLFLLLAYYTASRKKALFNLKWYQVDLDAKLINLNPRGHTQTHKRRPIVPIDDVLMPFLEIAVKDSKSFDDYVLQKNGDPVRQMEDAYRAADIVLKSKNLPLIGRASAHVIRHTRAVHLAQDGTDLYVIACLLGDSIATVERNYLHHCPEHIRNKINASKALGRFDLVGI